MYGVPPDLDPGPFVGSRVIKVGLSNFITEFVFEIATLDYGSIHAEGPWEARSGDGTVLGGRSRDQLTPEDLVGVPFSEVLGSTVEAWEASSPTHFDVILSTGVRVRFHDDSEMYESIHIEHEGGGYLI